MAVGDRIAMNSEGSSFESHGMSGKSGGGMGASGYAAAGEAALQIGTGLQQAQMMRRQGRLTSMIAEMNAEFAELDAYDSEKYTEEVVAKQQTEGDKVIGEQRNAIAGDNVDVNFGTAKDIQAESQLNSFLNVLDIRQQGRAHALGIRREARNMRLQSMMNSGATQVQANAVQTQGFLNAGATGANYYMRTK